MSLVQIVIDILADLRLALDLARILTSKEGRPRVTVHDCRKVRRERTSRLDRRWQESFLWRLVNCRQVTFGIL